MPTCYAGSSGRWYARKAQRRALERGQSSNEPYGYTGGWWGSYIELLHLRARWYSPYLNQFISPDTIIPNYFNPQSLNQYSYVLNNPVNLIDPSGYQGEPGAGVLNKIGACFVAAFAIPDPGPTELACGVIAIGVGIYVVASPIIVEGIKNGTITFPHIDFTFSQSSQYKIPLPPNACSLGEGEIRIGGILPFPSIGPIVGSLPGFGEGEPLPDPFIYRPGPMLGGEFTGPLHLPGPLTEIQSPLQIPGIRLGVGIPNVLTIK